MGVVDGSMRFMDISESSNKNADIAPRPWVRDHIIRSAPWTIARQVLQIDRKTIYAYVERGLIPYLQIESSLRFSKQ